MTPDPLEEGFVVVGRAQGCQALSQTHAMWPVENERDGGLVRPEKRADVWETCRGSCQVQGGAGPNLIVAWGCRDQVSQLGFSSVSCQQLRMELPCEGAGRVYLLGGRAQEAVEKLVHSTNLQSRPSGVRSAAREGLAGWPLAVRGF